MITNQYLNIYYHFIWCLHGQTFWHSTHIWSFLNPSHLTLPNLKLWNWAKQSLPDFLPQTGTSHTEHFFRVWTRHPALVFVLWRWHITQYFFPLMLTILCTGCPWVPKSPEFLTSKFPGCGVEKVSEMYKEALYHLYTSIYKLLHCILWPHYVYMKLTTECSVLTTANRWRIYTWFIMPILHKQKLLNFLELISYLTYIIFNSLRHEQGKKTHSILFTSIYHLISKPIKFFFTFH